MYVGIVITFTGRQLLLKRKEMQAIGTIFVVTSTYPNLADAQRSASELVKRGLSRCAQVKGTVTSYYEWQGEFCEEEEYSVDFKVSEVKHQEFYATFMELHPYDVPQYYWSEVKASPQYAEWVNSPPAHEDQ